MISIIAAKELSVRADPSTPAGSSPGLSPQRPGHGRFAGWKSLLSHGQARGFAERPLGGILDSQQVGQFGKEAMTQERRGRR